MQLQVLQLNSFHLSPSMAAPGRSLLRRGKTRVSCIPKPSSLVLQREKPEVIDVILMAQHCGNWNVDFRGCCPCQFVLMSRQESASWSPQCNHTDASVCACTHVCLTIPGSSSESYSTFRQIECSWKTCLLSLR